MKHLLYILVLLAIAGCASKQTETKEDKPAQASESRVVLTEAQYNNAGIQLGSVTSRALDAVLRLNGKVDVPPQNMVSISVPLGGYLKSTTLLPGMHVRKGQIIAFVEDPVYIQLQQDYLTAKARLVFLEKEYRRQRELNQSKAVSDKVSQQAEVDYLADKISMTSLSQKLLMVGIDPRAISEDHIVRHVAVTSPINGFVSKVNANIGKYVPPTDVLFELVNPDDIHLALKVFEKDLGKLFIGQQVIAYSNGQPGKKYAAQVLLIGHDLSPERTAEIHCHFEDYDKALVPGTYMNADVVVKSNVAEVLPQEAIVEYEGTSYVFVSSGVRTYEMVVVHTGGSANGFTEVVSPSLAGKAVVVKGAYSLLMVLKNAAE